MTRNASRLAPLLAVGGVLVGGALPAVEIAASRLVFEKAVRMKKIDASLYLSFPDQTETGDRSSEPRRLRCGVMARGKNGPLAVAGSLRLGLLGEAAGGTEVWESRTLVAPVDVNGDASFGADQIDGLVAAAAVAGAEVGLARVDFAGGRGGRVTELTLDCLRERSAT